MVGIDKCKIKLKLILRNLLIEKCSLFDKPAQTNRKSILKNKRQGYEKGKLDSFKKKVYRSLQQSLEKNKILTKIIQKIERAEANLRKK